MAGHGSEQVACSWIPELDGLIFRTAGKDVGFSHAHLTIADYGRGS